MASERNCNYDGIGINTARPLLKTLTESGQKQVKQILPAERSELETVWVIVSGLEKTILPMNVSWSENKR